MQYIYIKNKINEIVAKICEIDVKTNKRKKAFIKATSTIVAHTYICIYIYHKNHIYCIHTYIHIYAYMKLPYGTYSPVFYTLRCWIGGRRFFFFVKTQVIRYQRFFSLPSFPHRQLSILHNIIVNSCIRMCVMHVHTIAININFIILLLFFMLVVLQLVS